MLLTGTEHREIRLEAEELECQSGLCAISSLRSMWIPCTQDACMMLKQVGRVFVADGSEETWGDVLEQACVSEWEQMPIGNTG